MRLFADLYDRLDRTTSTNEKLAALIDHFRAAPPRDAAWALAILCGHRLKRTLPASKLAAWCMELTSTPEWLFKECHAAAGDLAETIALLTENPKPPLPPTPHPPLGLADWIEARLLPLRDLDDNAQRSAVLSWWAQLPRPERFILIKLLTGSLRVGVSRATAERAIAHLAGLPVDLIAHRLCGPWRPTESLMQRLLSPPAPAADSDSNDPANSNDPASPYPFFLASPVLPPELPAEFQGSESDWVAQQLGDPALWLAEWKWDGVRAQLIKRRAPSGPVLRLWSRGDEDLTHRFPEIIAAAARLPSQFVLDGEILVWDHHAHRQRPFADLQRRIGRLSPGKETLRQFPAVLMAYDLLEAQGQDLRPRPIEDRLGALRALLDPPGPTLLIAPPANPPANSWHALLALRATSRDHAVEGLMLKRRGSPYASGRRRGDWWKWKIEPLTIDAVLTYAQPGHGRRAGLLTDYTLALWDDNLQLVTIAKAYSGLSDAEIQDLDRWIRRHTLERFGPVRRVEPMRVFELAFEAVRPSPRHRSGVALRFPRIKRLRPDKKPEQADSLAALRAMISSPSSPSSPPSTP